MRRVRSFWLLAALLVGGMLNTGTAFGQGYFDSYYESFWDHPLYQNHYHGYWRDLGYGFSNRPVYGSLYRSESYWAAPYYGLRFSPNMYSVPPGPQRRR